jgi:hypothetical protein
MRILHVPSDTGNFGPLMARLERKLGHDAWSIVFARNYLIFEADEVFGGRSIKELLLLEIKRWSVFFRAMTYDVIMFNFGSTILPNPIFIGWGLSSKFKPRFRLLYTLLSLPFSLSMFDVIILKLMGKKIFVVFQGGDARQGKFLREHFKWSDWQEEPEGYYNPVVDWIKKARAWAWDRLATEIYYINPDLGHVLPKRAKFLPYLVEVNEMRYLPVDREKKRTILGHIVNHREPKGTRLVLEAVHALRMEGLDFGFVFAERVSHESALKLYEEVDVMLEQFVIGWYGLQAVEFMSMGRPVMAFIREEDMKFTKWQPKDLPIFQVKDIDLQEIKRVIKEILGMSRDELYEKGLEARKWVMANHDADALARQIEAQWEGEVGC